MTDESTKVFQDEANETTQENNNKTRKIATAAGIAAGALGVGGAVGYAATHESDKPVEVPQDPVPEEPTPEPKVVERVIVREAPAAQPAPQSAPQEDDNQIVYDVDNAEVEVIEVGQTGEGSYYATAQIDGHAAVFVDGDSNGTVDVLGIDVNNNGSLENNEVMDISDRNISMHSLASAAPANPGPTPVGPTPVGPDTPGINVSELHVGQVAHDVEVNGQTADMATVEYRGHAGVIADVNQDGRGDAALIDMNDNGSFEEQEVFDIRQSNVSMNDNNTIPVNDSEINASEIQVGQVAYDVEVNGQTADMATAEYRGHAGVIADINQDGRGDAAFIDMNDSGSFENQEIYDIRQSNVSMDGNNTGAINVADPQPVAEPVAEPIADPEPEPQPEPEPEPEPEPYIDPMGEPDPLAATDGLPDYTNGGDVDGYII